MTIKAQRDDTLDARLDKLWEQCVVLFDEAALTFGAAHRISREIGRLCQHMADAEYRVRGAIAEEARVGNTRASAAQPPSPPQPEA